MNEKACSGCRTLVLIALRRLRIQDQFDKAAGWTVVAGKIDKLPDVDREKLLLVGACTAKFKKEGIFVDGCGPVSTEIVGAIVGEEQAVWWDYADISAAVFNPPR